MASSASRRPRSLNVWPGYVDALATLLLSVVFLLTVFVVGQFFLSQELTGRDATLARLNRQLADLTDLLALERSNRRTQEDEDTLDFHAAMRPIHHMKPATSRKLAT